MAPTKFSSVRHRPRPVVPRPSFRDDTNLIAFRYEKTVAAEPPIPIPPRNPSRRARPTSSSSSSVSTSPSSHHHPVVVAPPPPPIAPPTEEHPALRTVSVPRLAAGAGDWKRDSGLAAASSSTTTIREEDCEDEFLHLDKVDELVKAAAVLPVVQHVETTSDEEDLGGQADQADEDEASVYSNEPARCDLTRRDPCAAGSAATSPPLAFAATLANLASPSSETTAKTLPNSEPRPLSPTKRLPRSFSFRSVVSLTKSRSSRSLSLSEDPTAAAPAENPPMHSGTWKRGSEPLELPASKPTLEPRISRQASLISSSSASKSTKSPAKRFWTRSRSHDSSTANDRDDPFAPLAIPIPTDNLLDDDFIASLSFSKRGSVMFGGQRVLALDGTMDGQSTTTSTGAGNGTDTPATTLTSQAESQPHAQTESSALSSSNPGTQSHGSEDVPAAVPRSRDPAAPPNIRILAADVEMESQKVRSLYAVGEEIRWEDGAGVSQGERLETTLEAPVEEELGGAEPRSDAFRGLLRAGHSTPRSGASSLLSPEVARRETELAGGMEDWEDVDGAEIDRYGFISLPRPGSRLGTPTEMKSSQFSPRRRLQKRDATNQSSPLSGRHTPSRKVSAMSLNTQHSGMSATSLRSSRSVFRQAGNMLPHNRHRRWMDEAGDMLTVSPSLQDVAEEARVEKISESLKRKEWERSEKWRKMAKVVKNGSQGQGKGMEFEFDVKNPKLIERTWKGVPDRWRSAAWWSFLASAAKNHNGSPTEEQIVADFHRLQERASPDDVQIDLDVPRTINRHIMFRRRYRGGQRLMFRVLHALSIYFPVTGYVQGMASLAATLLCYFDEEKCFVMLVRMWELRGLDRIYRPGFAGLMVALDEFQVSWLHKDVAKRLTELCVDPTAYGTRWYLTLFNLSIPFPAQLRVWDVFLLLGEDTSSPTPTGSQQNAKPATKPTKGKADAPSQTPASGLDVLHATSAALIQALREVLLDSDFENAMRAVTSWIPVKDEDLLMKVTKAEWKTHQGKKKS